MTTENLLRQNCPELLAAGFDLNALSEMMDERFLGEYAIFFAAVDLFMNGHSNYVEDIRASVQQMARKQIGATAHRLKGASSNFHSMKIADITRDMESNADVWTQSQFQAHMSLLDARMIEFIAELKQLVTSFSKLQEKVA